MLRFVPIVIFAAVAVFLGIKLNLGDPSRLPSTMIGKQVPQVMFASLEGGAADGKASPGFTNADLAKGKVSIVNFWASWCTQCVEEHPLLGELKAKSGADLYGVNYKDDPAAARRYLGRYGNPYSTVGTDASGRAAIDWGVYGMPETFIVNGRGEIVYKHVGPLSPEAIVGKILPSIEAAKAAYQSGKN